MAVSVGLLALLGFRAAGQVSQVVTLAAGWNAVHLEVEPADAAPLAVFGAEEIEMVWAYFPPEGAVEFIQNQNLVNWNTPGWRFFVPRGERALLSNLGSLQGGRCYLVKTSAPVSLTISGRPIYRPVEWSVAGLTLAGFYVDPATAVSFQQWLLADAPVGAADLRIFDLAPSGEWRRVSNAAAETVVPGRAYWVGTTGAPLRSGPWTIDTVSRRGFDFGREGTLQRLQLRSQSSYPTAVGLVSPWAALVEQGEIDAATGQTQWWPLDGTVRSLQPDGALNVTLGLLRGEMVEAQSGLVTIWGGGQRVRLWAEAEASISEDGLWAGEVTIDAVSYVNATNQTTIPLPTRSELTFNVLIHRRADGTARLLKEAFVVGQRETLDGQSAVRRVVLDRPDNLANFEGLSVRQGRLVGTRLSAVSYDFPESSRLLAGQLQPGGVLTVVLPLAEVSPTHPMRHRYHREHDGLTPLGASFPANYPAHQREVWEMSRALTFSVAAASPDEPLIGTGVLNGTYSEVLTGAHKTPIHASGTFTLRRITTASLVE